MFKHLIESDENVNVLVVSFHALLNKADQAQLHHALGDDNSFLKWQLVNFIMRAGWIFGKFVRPIVFLNKQIE